MLIFHQNANGPLGFFPGWRSSFAKYYLRLLRSEGRTARAYLFDQWKDKDSDGDPVYFVAYAFKTSTGKLISHAEQNKRLYQTYQIGDTLDIRYLLDDPTICQERRSTGR